MTAIITTETTATKAGGDEAVNDFISRCQKVNNDDGLDVPNGLDSHDNKVRR
jgi:hypothetical protein